ncbi:MAG: hypothetical protein K6F04_01345 [bacterium]|nr:hypothetical protein [bacterium]
MKKITDVFGEKIKIQTSTENPAYDEAFEREEKACRDVAAVIHEKLKASGISDEIITTEVKSIKDITFKELFYILDGMLNSDLIKLYQNTSYNKPIQTIITNIIQSRNSK